MTTCLLSWKRSGFGFGCRVEHLVTVEVQSSQDDAWDEDEDEDEGVGGYGHGHDRGEAEINSMQLYTSPCLNGSYIGS
jgi:hypothetical protein